MPIPPTPASPKADRFDTCVARLLRTEGGRVDHPADHGGATAYGISLRFLLQHAGDPRLQAILGHNRRPSRADIDAMTPTKASAIYRIFFWDANRCGDLPAPLDAAVFDQCVNGGGATLLQKTLNLFRHGALVVDGDIGDATVAILRSVAIDPRGGVERLLTSFRTLAENRYRDIVRGNPTQKVFLDGWVKRARKLGDI